MDHPNLWDKLAKKIYSRYLYKGQTTQLHGKIYVGIINRMPEVKNHSWKISQYINIENGTTLRFIGLARDLHFEGDVEKHDSIFELVNPIVLQDPLNPNTVSKGDTICVTPSDRQYIFS